MKELSFQDVHDFASSWDINLQKAVVIARVEQSVSGLISELIFKDKDEAFDQLGDLLEAGFHVTVYDQDNMFHKQATCELEQLIQSLEDS